jgi:hypothetical protein
MMDDMNDLLNSIAEYEEWLEQEKQNAIRPKRNRKSKLEDFRVEILQKKAAGKSFQQIADYLLNIHGVRCDRTTVFDFYFRCISE